MSKTRTIEEPETMYKVLDGLKSPIRGNFRYEIGDKYRCEGFNDDPAKDCAEGFYATALEGLPYAWNQNLNIYQVEAWGRAVEIDEFKRRYENIKIVKELDPAVVAEEAKGIEEELGYRLSEVIQPVDPTKIEPPEITDEHIRMLEDWKYVFISAEESVRGSVWESVRDSVWDSVLGPVEDSVLDSVGCSTRLSAKDSVWESLWYSVKDSVVESSVLDSVYGYVGSLFFDIDNWEWIEHKAGEYPFQPAVELWRQGLVPSYDGEAWRLHGGEDMNSLWGEKGDE